jgi:hypothetical protein
VVESSKHKIPRFLFEGCLDTTNCNIEKSFTGTFTIRESALPVKSVELQLVRVETCLHKEGEAREATEVQNIQVRSAVVCSFDVISCCTGARTQVSLHIIHCAT